MKDLRHVGDVAAWRLCVGCGACAYACPDGRIGLLDVIQEGIRPRVSAGDCGTCRDCLLVCPALGRDHRGWTERPGIDPELYVECGPVLEVWEGHAADEEVRHRGSSGGLITALSLYCLEQAGSVGVLHIGADEVDPTRNRTKVSRSRAELLQNAGSRYAPASVCDGLGLIESASGWCVLVGQPSEIAAARKAAELRPGLARNLGLTISFLCAGSPPTQATHELLRKLGVSPSQVGRLRYRGHGWPGMFSVTRQGESAPCSELTYKESWSFLQAYRPFSVYLWPDGTGEDADITCGDPWYRPPTPGEAGLSVVVVRTERGRQIIQGAMQAGFVVLKPLEKSKLLQTTEGLNRKRGAVWGRIWLLRLLGLPAPRFEGYRLGRAWLRLPIKEKLRSTLGTLRRILGRRYHRRLDLERMESVPTLPPDRRSSGSGLDQVK